MTFINSIRKTVALAIAFVLFFIAGTNGTKTHTVLDEENCKLNIAVLSDVHIEGNNFSRYKTFERIIRDVKNTKVRNDVAVFLGDNTMNGQEIESLLFYGAVKTVDFADNYITVMGNHDIGNGEGNLNMLTKRFIDYNNTFLSADIDKPYYCKVIKGCYFIALAPEELCVHEFPISSEQLDFLEECINKAKADNAVAFVCCHYPVDFADFDEYVRMRSILRSYDNIFYLSGHTHMPIIDGWTFEEYFGCNFINLPRCTELGDGDKEIIDETGDGIQIEVYENEVVARVRNYYHGEWNEEMVQHYEINR